MERPANRRWRVEPQVRQALLRRGKSRVLPARHRSVRAGVLSPTLATVDACRHWIAGWQSFVSDPEVPAIMQEAGHQGSPRRRSSAADTTTRTSFRVRARGRRRRPLDPPEAVLPRCSLPSVTGLRQRPRDPRGSSSDDNMGSLIAYAVLRYAWLRIARLWDTQAASGRPARPAPPVPS
jgi:hypothetical protein